MNSSSGKEGSAKDALALSKARRCHVALIGFHGLVGCGLLRKLTGAESMALSIARAVVDCEVACAVISGAPTVCSLCIVSMFGRLTFSPSVDISLFVIPVCHTLRPRNVY